MSLQLIFSYTKNSFTSAKKSEWPSVNYQVPHIALSDFSKMALCVSSSQLFLLG